MTDYHPESWNPVRLRRGAGRVGKGEKGMRPGIHAWNLVHLSHTSAAVEWVGWEVDACLGLHAERPPRPPCSNAEGSLSTLPKPAPPPLFSPSSTLFFPPPTPTPRDPKHSNSSAPGLTRPPAPGAAPFGPPSAGAAPSWRRRGSAAPPPAPSTPWPAAPQRPPRCGRCGPTRQLPPHARGTGSCCFRFLLLPLLRPCPPPVALGLAGGRAFGGPAPTAGRGFWDGALGALALALALGALALGHGQTGGRAGRGAIPCD